jgi:DNA invertase Pin-like site-specific DNA recombinase
MHRLVTFHKTFVRVGVSIANIVHKSQILEDKKMLIGYARVSTEDQNPDLQLGALKRAGCERVFCDRGISGAKMTRPELMAAIHAANAGGTLVVWRLDRLGRSLTGLVQLIDELRENEIELRSLTESIDTSSSSGNLFFHIMAALSEFERTLISERTKAGLQATRARGVKLGRPRLLTDAQIQKVAREVGTENMSLKSVSEKLGVSERTLQRYMQQRPQ